MNWKYYYFKEVNSTNDEALNYPVGSVIIAQKQTAGRGRYGRQWLSEDGNLFLSAVLPDYGNDSPLLTFVAAVSVADSLADFPVRIKWPNDILLNGGKLAGILLERTDDKVIIGIGINLVSAPTQNMLYRTASLNGKVAKEDLIMKLTANLAHNAELLAQDGFAPIRDKWLKYAVGIGETIRVSLPNETLSGIFESFTPQGAISLKQANNTVRLITVGDVFFEQNKKG